jgi:hypothetical protein
MRVTIVVVVHLVIRIARVSGIITTIRLDFSDAPVKEGE